MVPRTPVIAFYSSSRSHSFSQFSHRETPCLCVPLGLSEVLQLKDSPFSGPSGTSPPRSVSKNFGDKEGRDVEAPTPGR